MGATRARIPAQSRPVPFGLGYPDEFWFVESISCLISNIANTIYELLHQPIDAVAGDASGSGAVAVSSITSVSFGTSIASTRFMIVVRETDLRAEEFHRPSRCGTGPTPTGNNNQAEG